MKHRNAVGDVIGLESNLQNARRGVSHSIIDSIEITGPSHEIVVRTDHMGPIHFFPIIENGGINGEIKFDIEKRGCSGAVEQPKEQSGLGVKLPSAALFSGTIRYNGWSRRVVKEVIYQLKWIKAIESHLDQLANFGRLRNGALGPANTLLADRNTYTYWFAGSHQIHFEAMHLLTTWSQSGLASINSQISYFVGSVEASRCLVGASAPRWRVVPSVTLGGGASSPVLRLGNELTRGAPWIAG